MRYRYRNRKNNSRGLISVISYLIRQFYMPNPFGNIFKNPANAEIANWLFGGIFIPLAYFATGTWYASGSDAKWVGSLGFFINYCILTGLLLFISKFVSDIYWIIGFFIFLYIILCIAEFWLFNRNSSRY